MLQNRLSNLDSDLLIYTLLLLLDLFLKLLESCPVRCRTVSLEDLDVPVTQLACAQPCTEMVLPYSSVKGVIFFSSTSSSAKFFWYFSQL